MKKNSNNKYKNGNNGNGHSNNYSNNAYSLNYRFDSNSCAGKCSGTALDLIKKYNELARDALNNNDRVLSENFRQYAEHYRKILTDINERKGFKTKDMPEEVKTVEAPTESASEQPQEPKVKKSFQVIEIKDHKEEQTPKTPRTRKISPKKAQEATAVI